MNRSLIIAVAVLAAAVLGGAAYLFLGGESDRQIVGVDGVVGDDPATPTDSDATPTGDEATGFRPMIQER